MSHFTVTIALPPDTTNVTKAITDLMAPFDENKEVEQHTDEDTYWRNPDAKWDWWVIGGRWRGYFIPAPNIAMPDPQSESDAITGLPEVLRTEYRSRFGGFGDGLDEAKPGRVDGGRIRALDLKALRDHKATEAEKAWNEYAMVIDGTPQHLPWKTFYEKVRASEAAAPKPWKHLCEEAYERARQAHGFSSEEQFDEWLKTVDDDTDDSYLAYVRDANAYIDSLPDDAYLVVLDCHI